MLETLFIYLLLFFFGILGLSYYLLDKDIQTLKKLYIFLTIFILIYYVQFSLDIWIKNFK